MFCDRAFGVNGFLGRASMLFFICLIVGCASNPYTAFYTQIADAADIDDVFVPAQEVEPKVIKTSDIDSNLRTARSMQYDLIGYSSFNGEYQKNWERKVAEHAKKIGAIMALVQISYSDTGIATDDSGKTYSYRRYNQKAYFFVKTIKKYRVGVLWKGLSADDRIRYKRNTGALIDVVYHGSPAFKANIVENDIVIQIDLNPIASVADAQKALRSVPDDQASVIFKIVRDGKIRDIEVHLD
nr:PDZ domain-containing protein [Alcanivorax sp. 1008]